MRKISLKATPTLTPTTDAPPPFAPPPNGPGVYGGSDGGLTRRRQAQGLEDAADVGGEDQAWHRSLEVQLEREIAQLEAEVRAAQRKGGKSA